MALLPLSPGAIRWPGPDWLMALTLAWVLLQFGGKDAGLGALVLGCLAAIAVGLAVGCWQGFWVAYVGIPAFIVTLAGMLIFRGLTLQVRRALIGSLRNSARGVLFWNLALDQANGPHAGGCDTCRGVVTIDSRTGAVTRTDEYYALAHASRFVRPGAYRIESSGRTDGLDNVAFSLKARSVPKLRQSIGCVFQDFRLLQKKTVAENVAWGLEVEGLPKAARRARVDELLGIVGLGDMPVGPDPALPCRRGQPRVSRRGDGALQFVVCRQRPALRRDASARARCVEVAGLP